MVHHDISLCCLTRNESEEHRFDHSYLPKTVLWGKASEVHHPTFSSGVQTLISATFIVLTNGKCLFTPQWMAYCTSVRRKRLNKKRKLAKLLTVFRLREREFDFSDASDQCPPKWRILLYQLQRGSATLQKVGWCLLSAIAITPHRGAGKI